MNIHIGQRIQEIAKQKRLTIQEVKDIFGTERSPSYTYKKQSLPLDLLWRICEKMNHNFFAELHPHIVTDIPPLPKELNTPDQQDMNMAIYLRIDFTATAAPELGRFIRRVSNVGQKMGFKIGEKNP